MSTYLENIVDTEGNINDKPDHVVIKQHPFLLTWFFKKIYKGP